MKFYQRLDRHNISKGVFQKELSEHWMYLHFVDNEVHSKLAQGTKRPASAHLDDGEPRVEATWEHSRGWLKRRIERHQYQEISNPLIGDLEGHLFLDSTTQEENMELVIRLMERLNLDVV